MWPLDRDAITSDHLVINGADSGAAALHFRRLSRRSRTRGWPRNAELPQRPIERAQIDVIGEGHRHERLIGRGLVELLFDHRGVLVRVGPLLATQQVDDSAPGVKWPRGSTCAVSSGACSVIAHRAGLPHRRSPTRCTSRTRGHDRLPRGRGPRHSPGRSWRHFWQLAAEHPRLVSGAEFLGAAVGPRSPTRPHGARAAARSCQG